MTSLQLTNGTCSSGIFVIFGKFILTKKPVSTAVNGRHFDKLYSFRKSTTFGETIKAAVLKKYGIHVDINILCARSNKTEICDHAVKDIW